MQVGLAPHILEVRTSTVELPRLCNVRVGDDWLACEDQPGSRQLVAGSATVKSLTEVVSAGGSWIDPCQKPNLPAATAIAESLHCPSSTGWVGK
ncbi:unnamed protein product [Clonostachys rhizophaga]|uniref:Uncharacterized protein n=1 Tax=Clonostachys rhizophaga TaxID=160324 RepID=A0A9N9VKM2_9HYPO|nr:unnamed protein product [Clonostachys rhizophaga]